MIRFKREDLEGTEFQHLHIVEKQLRLVALLNEIFRDPFLKDAIALKGGTALNLVLWDLPRLSIDLDFNYIGQIHKEKMENDRNRIRELLARISNLQGYEVEKEGRKYAQDRFVLRFTSYNGSQDRVEIEVNYMLRVPLFGTFENKPKSIMNKITLNPVRMLSLEELASAKFCALLYRATARDLFDAYYLIQSSAELLNAQRLRSAFLFYCCLQSSGIGGANLTSVQSISQNEIYRGIAQNLKRGIFFDRDNALKIVVPFLEKLIRLSHAESAFFESFRKKEFAPKLLFGDIDNLEQIKQHPQIAWLLRRKEIQRVLKFQLRGIFNSFREPGYTVYHRTLPFPPKTTLCGMFGAALGLSPEEVNTRLLQGKPPGLEVAVIVDQTGGDANDLWKIKKVAIGEKSTEDVVKIGDKYYFGAVIVREMLFAAQFTIYVRSTDDALLEQLYNAMQNPVWALSLGRDDELVRVIGLEWCEVSELEEAISYERVVLPAEKYTMDMETLKATNGKSKRIQPPLIAKLPTRFLYEENGEREGRDWQPFLFASGIAVKPVNSRARAYTDGENHFQFF